jgi:hypothetical protein
MLYRTRKLVALWTGTLMTVACVLCAGGPVCIGDARGEGGILHRSSRGRR